MGISLSGLAAYEQMIMGRALLYDRLYYHHKVRAAEEMLRELIREANRESGEPLTLPNYFALASETEYVSIWGGSVKSEFMASGGIAARRIADALVSRQIYHRAACFAARFIAGLGGLPNKSAAIRDSSNGTGLFKCSGRKQVPTLLPSQYSRSALG